MVETTNFVVTLWVRIPLVPETVIIPLEALLFVKTISVLEEIVGFCEKLQLAPDGTPVHDKLTELLKPPLGFIETVYVVELPAFTVCDDGLMLRLKSGVADGGGLEPEEIVRLAVAVFTRGPLVPFTVNETVPVGALLAVFTVKLYVPGDAGLGEKLQLEPLGKSEQERVTLRADALVKVT